jgi:PIN domain nuclease of toxin-antitoxin system
VTLLDTNAVIWAHLGHARGRRLARLSGRCYVSPATVLELQLLVELGRLTLAPGATAPDLVGGQNCLIDDPPSVEWFGEAAMVGWTRDPFDRLIVAHARLRGWAVATGDARMLEELGPRRSIEL